MNEDIRTAAAVFARRLHNRLCAGKRDAFELPLSHGLCLGWEMEWMRARVYARRGSDSVSQYVGGGATEEDIRVKVVEALVRLSDDLREVARRMRNEAREAETAAAALRPSCGHTYTETRARVHGGRLIAHRACRTCGTELPARSTAT